MPQWNSFNTKDPFGAIETNLINYKSADGTEINAYTAIPKGDGKRGGVVLVHHMPGWDELYREFANRWANHGFNVICPNLYARAGHGTPDDVTAKVRGDGGVADATVLADCEAAMKWLKALPSSNGKVGITGTCSGGRHSYLVACKVPGFAAIINCWGGGVVANPDQLNDKQPVAPVDYTKDLEVPVLGLFGNDDQRPSPDDVNKLEEELKKHGKKYEFHRYDGAGHGFFYYDRPNYRQQQAMDGWSKAFAFFDQHLS